MASHLDQFITTIARLRAPDGCPWDREQTHASLGRYLLEEAYEVLEAIHNGDPEKLKEELGDLLLQIALHAQLAKDSGDFDIQDVAQAINAKMLRRHPHVFGENKLSSAKEVLGQWDALKEKERSDKPPQSAIDGVPSTLPALLQALKVSEKAVNQGFEWESEGQVWEKLFSELNELKEAVANPDLNKPESHLAARREVHLEMGDVLFTLVNIGRWHSLTAEESLLMAIEKFKTRFRKMEEISDRPLKSLTPKELDDLWERAKASLKAPAEH